MEPDARLDAETRLYAIVRALGRLVNLTHVGVGVARAQVPVGLEILLDLVWGKLGDADVGEEKGETRVDAGLGDDFVRVVGEPAAGESGFESAAVPLEVGATGRIDVELIDGVSVRSLNLVGNLRHDFFIFNVDVTLAGAVFFCRVRNGDFARAVTLRLDLDLVRPARVLHRFELGFGERAPLHRVESVITPVNQSLHVRVVHVAHVRVGFAVGFRVVERLTHVKVRLFVILELPEHLTLLLIVRVDAHVVFEVNVTRGVEQTLADSVQKQPPVILIVNLVAKHFVILVKHGARFDDERARSLETIRAMETGTFVSDLASLRGQHASTSVADETRRANRSEIPIGIIPDRIGVQHPSDDDDHDDDDDDDDSDDAPSPRVPRDRR